MKLRQHRKTNRERRLEAIELANEKSLMEADYWEFLKSAFPVIDAGKELVEAEYLEYIAWELQRVVERVAANTPKDKDLALNVPPRSLKSVMMICLCAWAWIRWPEMRFASASYSGDLSIEHNVKFRNLITSEWYQARWGSVFRLTSTKKSNVTNDKGGFRFATSVGGTFTGKGADIIFVDDPIKPLESASEKAREEAKTWFTQTASSRLDQPDVGQFIVVMQRVHDDDLCGYLQREEKDEWRFIVLPAQLTKAVGKGLRRLYKNGLLHPGRFTKSVLKRLKKRLGSLAFAGQYLQAPAPAEGAVIKSRYFGTYRPIELKDREYTVNFYADTAFTKELTNDPSVILAYTVLDGFLYILNISEVWMEYPDFKKHLHKWTRKNGYTGRSKIDIESAATGLPLVQELKRPLYDENGKQVGQGLNLVPENVSGSKLERVYAELAKMEAGFVLLPYHAPWKEGFIQQAVTFPNGLHDDQVDCLTGAMRKGLKESVWKHI